MISLCFEFFLKQELKIEIYLFSNIFKAKRK